jgi:hypothetical protein
MWIFEVKPTRKTRRWLAKYKVNHTALSLAITALFADIRKCKKYKKITLVLQVDSPYESSYVFGTNKIRICSDPDPKAKSLKQKKFVIFLHFLHEFRHWMQSRVFNIKDNQLQYTQEDVDKNTHAYWHNKYEKDARVFERRYVRRFMRYYINFRNGDRQ